MRHMFFIDIYLNDQSYKVNIWNIWLSHAYKMCEFGNIYDVSDIFFNAKSWNFFFAKKKKI